MTMTAHQIAEPEIQVSVIEHPLSDGSSSYDVGIVDRRTGSDAIYLSGVDEESAASCAEAIAEAINAHTLEHAGLGRV